ncbi:hypothetical protein B296_00053092 [Ensete ventricosum]|uniref:Uncharacterized protein n=1 Tax=Ensete ventricosum TaxID=4639 RepID=A0A426X539_ENSVE|nr:hypothetical protein B296_00053092 [Ensete ventricosum]
MKSGGGAGSGSVAPSTTNVPAVGDAGVSTIEKHPSFGAEVGLRKCLWKAATEQPTDASGNTTRTSIYKGKGTMELGEVPEQGTEGPLSGEYLLGALHPTLSKQVYKCSSEELMNRVGAGAYIVGVVDHPYLATRLPLWLTLSSYTSTMPVVLAVRDAFTGEGIGLTCVRSVVRLLGYRSYLCQVGRTTAGDSALPVPGRPHDHWRPHTCQELGNCDVARVNPTEQELGNCDVARVDPTEQELENFDVARADPTEQELENCDVARGDPTEQELGNFVMSQELIRPSRSSRIVMS